jgi:phospholipase C
VNPPQARGIEASPVTISLTVDCPRNNRYYSLTPDGEGKNLSLFWSILGPFFGPFCSFTTRSRRVSFAVFLLVPPRLHYPLNSVIRWSKEAVLKKILAFGVVTLFSCALSAQTPHFTNILILIQENRTPDNLLSSCNIPGADMEESPDGVATPLVTKLDPLHNHAGFLKQLGGVYTTDEYDYVSDSLLQPYCQLGAQYGFANRMFQTNQGSSTPAHLFLLAGSSQLSTGSDLFLSETAALNTNGCPSSDLATFINSAGLEIKDDGPDCLSINSLPSLITEAGLSWRYYLPKGAFGWNAPQQVSGTCQADDGVCAAKGWSENVITSPKQVLTDIQNGNLASVSWVVPAPANSDHPNMNRGGGPAWISSIVDAVGSSPYWQSTAILVTWDDWGGWYDHVSPPANNTGFCPSYCYGFRVPLMVISPYTPAMVDNDLHDFGSILHFIESNFNLGNLGVADIFADNLSEFFQSGSERKFEAIDPVRAFDPEDEGKPDDD